MRVMVTGGTGFVGCHTVAELVHNGHQVTLLARKMERVGSALRPLGLDNVNTILGDVTEQGDVEEAARGCEATIHCASVYSLDPRANTRIKNTNVRGTETVLSVAHRLGHDPIVHVSSMVALLGQKGATLTPDSLPGSPSGAYCRSKADSDRIARKFQEAGAPVVITYPGSVWGPHDPHFGESCQMASNILHRYWVVVPRGTVCITDVRDLAQMHSSLLEKGRGPRRYIAPATNTNIAAAASIMASATGRKLPTISVPASTLLWPAKALEWLQYLLPFRLPLSYQALYIAGLSSSMDDSKTRNEFGIEPRALEETLLDTIIWMAQEGHLPRKLVGNLLSMN